MWLRFTVGSAAITSRTHELQEGAPKSWISLSFDLYGHDRDHLDLETGETFAHPAVFRRKDGHVTQRDIGARLAVLRADEEGDCKNSSIRYFSAPPNRSDVDEAIDSEILLNVWLPNAAFEELLNNVRSGLLPKEIDVTLKAGFVSGIFSYGWEPDGSGIKWANKNKENQKVAIENLSLVYSLKEAEVDSSTKQVVTRSTHSLSDMFDLKLSEIVERLLKPEAAVASVLKYMRFLIGAILGALALWLFNHR